MNALGTQIGRRAGGYTLTEVMVSMAIGTMVVVGTLNVSIMFLRSYNTSTLMRTSGSRACLALERVVVGVGTNAGLREAAASTLTYTNPASGWRLSYNTNLFLNYVASSKIITNERGKVLCTNVIASSISFYTKPVGTGIGTNGCQISLSVAEKAGGDTWTNTMSTQIQFRN